MEIVDILRRAQELGSSDIHIVVGKPPIFRISGELKEMENAEKIFEDEAREKIYSVLNERQIKEFELKHDLDFSFGISGLGRFRANIHMQRGTVAAAFRAVNTEVAELYKLGLPEIVAEFAEYKNGIVLVTGPTGSGKSTTLAALINKINNEKSEHIITIEDPIEYLHRHKQSIIEQREVKSDTASFSDALRFAMRQDPDVILIGELRDLETIEAALTAAETGHLVFATLHTNSAAKTVDRIIDVFPEGRQNQIRTQLSTVLRAVVSQTLVKDVITGGRLVVPEIMVVTPAIANLIREGKTFQITSAMETGGRFGMKTMSAAARELFNQGKISQDTHEKLAGTSLLK